MDMETIKRKVLEDVDPEIKRQKKREVRVQRLIGTVQFLAIVVYKRHSVEYKQGDVIAIERPNGEDYVKRIIAVPGDTRL